MATQKPSMLLRTLKNSGVHLCSHEQGVTACERSEGDWWSWCASLERPRATRGALTPFHTMATASIVPSHPPLPQHVLMCLPAAVDRVDGGLIGDEAADSRQVAIRHGLHQRRAAVLVHAVHLRTRVRQHAHHL